MNTHLPSGTDAAGLENCHSKAIRNNWSAFELRPACKNRELETNEYTLQGGEITGSLLQVLR